MVSFWPWKGNDTSPASFEKSLSAISGKITRASTDLDTCRQRARRLKALWTLYTSFAYLLYLMIIGLVVGFSNCGVYEYTGLAGGPVIIYTVRLALATYYDYRTSRLQSHLESLQKQRDTIIAKLKAATKYDSTQQLLEKYGGMQTRPKTKTSQRKPSDTGGPSGPRNAPGRPMVVPPPTANIPHQPPLGHASAPNSPNPSTPRAQLSNPPHTAAAVTPPWTQQRQPTGPFNPDDSAEFAPNAFSAPSTFAQAYSDGGFRWYDRLLDVLLGEDETSAKNRLALICTNCRLVNGQAPPGARRLEDIGKWRCSGCGTMNGVEDEGKRLVAEITGKGQVEESPQSSKSAKIGKLDEEPVLVEKEGDESDVTQYSEEEVKEEEVEQKPEEKSEVKREGKPKARKRK